MTATETEQVSMNLIDVHDLRAHPANRKHFDETKLKELADNLEAVGQLTPLLVRDKGQYYEILAGERRWRAAKMAKIPTLLCRIVEMTDTQALEALLVENMQREDVHPLEEASAYAALIKIQRLDVEAIAAKVGKSAKYVYDRMKLLQLIPALQKLFLEEKFLAGHAILLARLTKADQARCLGTAGGSRGYGDGGLFQNEQIDTWIPGLAQPEEYAFKAVSVRELQHWIDDNVRLNVDAIDGFLMPETAQTIAAAKEEAEKVVQITHDHYVRPEARDDKTRTFGPQSWKRADGSAGSKACEHAITGVVVVGPQRGESFKVCIAKKTCSVHWKKERAEANRRGKLRAEADGGSESGQARWKQEEEKREQQRQKEEAERARWMKARPQLMEALVAKLKAAPAGPGSKAAALVLEEFRPYSAKKCVELLGAAKTAEDLVRHMALRSVLDTLNSSYWIVQNGPKILGAFGVEARKIVDQVSPKEPAVKVAKAKGTKRRAGDVAREKKAKAKKARAAK